MRPTMCVLLAFACNHAPESQVDPGWNVPTNDFCDGYPDSPTDVEIDGFTLCARKNPIIPIDDPILVSCSEARLPAETEVFSVFDGVDARAYAIPKLTGRELVHDEYGDGPLLVNW